MSTQKTNITSPVGRVVEGSLYNPNTTNFDGKPLTVQNGPNAGQARVDYFFALAIRKGAEQHWAHTAWGQKIWAVGGASFPQAAQRPDFAWKIIDGDSTIPNKKNTRPCDKEGYPGHWILRFSGGFAPKVYRQEGSGYVQVTEANYIKPGYFVEVAFSVDGNNNQNNPGVYLNHSMVCFRAYGPEITFGPDVNEAGFGQSQLPAGASLTPPPSAIPMPSGPTGAPAPSVTGVPPAALPTPIAVVPNPQFLQMPAVPAVNPSHTVSSAALPSVPAVLPPTPPTGAMMTSHSSVPKMTALAGGASYQAFITAGWTDANLIAQGYMTV